MGTFIIGGIWHGAGWTFVFWGFLHGIALVLQKVWNQLGFKLWTWLAWLITFNFVNIAWVFFRAKEWGDAVKVLSGMVSLDNIVVSKSFVPMISNNFLAQYITFSDTKWKTFISAYTLEMIILGFILILFFKNSNELGVKFNKIKEIPIIWYLLSIILLGTSFITMSIQTGSEFLYFNF